MKPRNLLKILFVLAVATFITSGDTFEFLPQPMRDASVTTREFLVSLWPDWLRPKDRNAEREQELDNLGQ